MTNREIDSLIATKVFGSKVDFLNQGYGWCVDYLSDKNECNDPVSANGLIDGYKLKYYSTNMKSAWEVLEKIRDTFDPLGREWLPSISYHGKKYGWRVGFELSNDNAADYKTYYFGEAETPEEAICLAALEMVGDNNG